MTDQTCVAVSDVSISVEVGLLSGKTAIVEARFDDDVETLRSPIPNLSGFLSFSSNSKSLTLYFPGIFGEVRTLKSRAQAALEVGTGRLVDSFGSVLDSSVAVKDSNLRNGDFLTLHICQLRVSRTGIFCHYSWRWIRRDMGSG